MHRFYLEQCTPPELVLTGSEAHHAVHVLRLDRGDHVLVLDGRGSQFLCEIEVAGRKAVRLSVLETRSAPAPTSRVTLVQALPKGKLIEDIIEKAVELGVSAIVPLITERVVKQVHAQDASRFRDKWQKVAMEAIKQCGAAWLPVVEKPQALTDFLSSAPKVEFQVVGSLQEGRKHPREYLADFKAAHRRIPASVRLWIGPEGDFTEGELSQILKSGAHPITMGDLVLRTETAAIYGLSILNYELTAP